MTGESRAVVDELEGDLPGVMGALARAGSADAFVMLRRVEELSEGQRYRLEIARAMLKAEAAARRGKFVVVLADEFLATLDRTTAKVVARLVSKWVKKGFTTENTENTPQQIFTAENAENAEKTSPQRTQSTQRGDEGRRVVTAANAELNHEEHEGHEGKQKAFSADNRERISPQRTQRTRRRGIQVEEYAPQRTQREEREGGLREPREQGTEGLRAERREGTPFPGPSLREGGEERQGAKTGICEEETGLSARGRAEGPAWGGVCWVAASSHDDLVEALEPEVLVMVGLGGEMGIVRR